MKNLNFILLIISILFHPVGKLSIDYCFYGTDSIRLRVDVFFDMVFIIYTNIQQILYIYLFYNHTNPKLSRERLASLSIILLIVYLSMVSRA